MVLKTLGTRINMEPWKINVASVVNYYCDYYHYDRVNLKKRKQTNYELWHNIESNFPSYYTPTYIWILPGIWKHW